MQQLEVEAAARELEGFKGFKGFKRLKPGKRAGLNALTREGYVQAKGRLQCWNADGQGAWWKLPRGMCRQRAGCNPGTAKADGQRASWKLPRGSWRVLRVLSV